LGASDEDDDEGAEEDDDSDDEPESDDDDSDDDPDSPEEDRDARVAPDEPPRSFLAQPEPLKWMVGGANRLRSVPSAPHDGQNFGPGSLIPWRMSAR
jgi:hypothetical protein